MPMQQQMPSDSGDPMQRGGGDGMGRLPFNPMFAGYMAQGGKVRPGEYAIVGENGPEIVQTLPDGSTEVQPLNDPPVAADGGPPVQTLGGEYALQDPPMPAGQPVSPVDAGAQELLDIGNAARAGQAYQPQPQPRQPLGMAPEPMPTGVGTSSATGMMPTTDIGDQAPPPINDPNSVQGINARIRDGQNYIDKTKAGQDGGPREKSLFKRLGSGLMQGWKNWDGEGGLFGGLAHAVAGGVGSAVSPQAHQVAKLEGGQKKLFGRLGMAQNEEQFEMKQNQGAAQIANYANQSTNRNAQTIISAGKAQADIARGDRAEGFKREEFNYRQKKDKIDQDREQARLDFEAGKINQKSMDDYTGEVSKYQGKLSEFNNERQKLTLEGQSKQNQAAEAEKAANDPSLLPTERLEKQAEAKKLREEGNALVKRGNEMQPPPEPTRPSANLQSPTIGAKTVSQAELQQIANKNNMTVAQARAAAEKDGYTIR
jgi:hypothetical protein